MDNKDDSCLNIETRTENNVEYMKRIETTEDGAECIGWDFKKYTANKTSSSTTDLDDSCLNTEIKVISIAARNSPPSPPSPPKKGCCGRRKKHDYDQSLYNNEAFATVDTGTITHIEPELGCHRITILWDNNNQLSTPTDVLVKLNDKFYGDLTITSVYFIQKLIEMTDDEILKKDLIAGFVYSCK